MGDKQYLVNLFIMYPQAKRIKIYEPSDATQFIQVYIDFEVEGKKNIIALKRPGTLKGFMRERWYTKEEILNLYNTKAILKDRGINKKLK